MLTAQSVSKPASMVWLALAVLLFASTANVLLPTALRAQATGDQQPRDTVTLGPLTITATRTAKDVFITPNPVSVLDQLRIAERMPNNVSDLFRDLPGLDVAGVGVTQVRPIIRGQRGQRILVLEDGMRLNNSRRQQDFGEIPALVDVTSVERVEVVRGPASVLYGSDAIGGVVNIITRTPQQEGLHGTASYRFSSHDSQNKVTASISGRYGKLSFRGTGTYRDAGPYDAPAGSFGNVTLDAKTPVFGTGVQDESFGARVGYEIGAGHEIFAKYEGYRADTTGFGFVDPEVYAPDLPSISIDYPFQRFDKVSLGYHASNLQSAVADKLDVVGYFQDNDRRFNLDVLVSGIPFGPNVVGDIRQFSSNFTDVTTVGSRIEASKLVGGRVMVTYGADFFHDDSNNSDSSIVEVRIPGVPGPPIPPVTTPPVPNASLRSVGVFVQGDMQLTDRATLVLGARYQDVHAETDQTAGLGDPGLSDTDRTLVASANGLYQLTDYLAAVASVGRAFRAPNLVERFFNGPTPEGQAFQVANPALEPETSFNLDFGLRYRNQVLDLEGFVFRNEIHNGIRISPTGDTTTQGQPMFQNVNVDKLRFWGVELRGDVNLPAGVSLGGTYTHQDSKNVLDENNPVGDSFDEKLTGRARYTFPTDRFWVEYAFRHNGDRKDVDLVIDNPVGPILPAFTVHAIRGGVTVFRRGPHVHRLLVVIDNLTNELYAEFANASFFRPQPGRSVTLTWDMSF